MTNEIFDRLKKRIKADETSVKSNWYDGHKWTDCAGNWYGWTNCGFVEHLFYAGEEYTRHTQPDGTPTTPELVKPFKPCVKQETKQLCEWLGDKMDCEPCVFGFIYGCGADAECPAMTRDEMLDTLMEIAEKAREAADRLGA